MDINKELEWRKNELRKLQEHYSDFRDFYADCSEKLLGFTPTPMQYRLAHYMTICPKWAMIQAQRSEAKTTIGGCYAVWKLIHNPRFRILIVSAGATLAKEISTWCIQILNILPELEILRCDKGHPGARASVEAYDVHYLLKGADKSPSIKCLGITSSMAGSRADLLISDDIESPKNALTEIMRQNLKQLTLEFSSINKSGQILYLGTPQSVDSVYNTLPSRNFDIRIFPGRYPTYDEEEYYGDYLDPVIKQEMTENPELRIGGGLNGDKGQATDPGMLDEETLQQKEADQGKAHFNLQFMLNTSLMDADRYPLKIKNLVLHDLTLSECPGKFTWSNRMDHALRMPSGTAVPKELLYEAEHVHPEYFPYSLRLMSIDPAGGGQNGDETGISIIYECNGYLLVQWVTGLPGGTSPERLQKAVDLIEKYGCNKVLVEKNFGNGAYAEALRGVMQASDVRCDVEEVWSTGQKELRIIDSLEPVMGIHKLIFSKRILNHDIESTQKYANADRAFYQLFFQMSKITRDRGALIHDDRLESLSQGVTYLMTEISKSADAAIAAKQVQKLREFQQDPNGLWRKRHTGFGAIMPSSRGSAFDRFRR